jgi:aminomethyltransferase
VAWPGYAWLGSIFLLLVAVLAVDVARAVLALGAWAFGTGAVFSSDPLARARAWAEVSALLDAATPLGGLPIGLGARDSLRLEAKLPLYGNDIDDDHTPLEAGLGWAVKLDKDFIGAAALREQKAKGITRQLVGFKIDEGERAIPRHGYPIVDRKSAEPTIGTVTSGGPALYVGGAIGLGYVPTTHSAPGTKLTIDCRGKDATATVVSGKFYKRAQ